MLSMLDSRRTCNVNDTTQQEDAVLSMLKGRKTCNVINVSRKTFNVINARQQKDM